VKNNNQKEMVCKNMHDEKRLSKGKEHGCLGIKASNISN
jgi:hypothetical protein